MKYKVVTNEIYHQIDEISYTAEKLKNASYILSECMIDSEFTEVQLESLATIIHERLVSLCEEFYKLLPEIEPDD